MLAVDIETANPDVPPDEKPDFQDTSDFELVAIAAGYRDKNGQIDTETFFRHGGWEEIHRTKLIDLFRFWCDEKAEDVETEPVLTYNGTRFDKLHLMNWAAEHAQRDMRLIFNNHIDLSDEKEKWLNTNAWSLEEVCESVGIKTEETYFKDYDIDGYTRGFIPEGDEVMSGKHLGESIGERYIEMIDLYCGENGAPERMYRECDRELKRMIEDYAKADIKPLFELYNKIQKQW